MSTACNQREKVKKQESKTNKSKKSRNNDTDKKNNTDGYLVYENKNDNVKWFIYIFLDIIMCFFEYLQFYIFLLVNTFNFGPCSMKYYNNHHGL